MSEKYWNGAIVHQVQKKLINLFHNHKPAAILTPGLPDLQNKNQPNC